MDDADIKDAMRWCRGTGKWAGREEQFLFFVSMIQKVAIKPHLLSVGSEIGKGSFGIINRGTLKGRQVAVKFVSKDVIAGPKELSQTLHEVRLELQVAMSLKHPSVNELLGVVAHFPGPGRSHKDWSIGLVFELCSEGDLHKMIHAKRQFSMLQKLSFASDIAAGLAYLQSLSVIHRDLGSRNVLITADGHAKICDFGCARFMKEYTYTTSCISGSPPWMAPEQILGRPLTLSVDVFAFGCILWELLTGKIPFHHRMAQVGLEKLQKCIQNERGLPAISDRELPNLDADMRQSIRRLIAVCVSSNPVLRPDAKYVQKIAESLHTGQPNHTQILDDVEYRAQLGRMISAFYQKFDREQLLPETIYRIVTDHADNLESFNEGLRKRYNADLNSFIPPGIKPLERPSSAPSRTIDSVATANGISLKQTLAKATSDQTVLRKIQTASRSAKSTEDRLSPNAVPFLSNEFKVFQEHRSVLESELGQLSKQVHALKMLEPDMKREFAHKQTEGPSHDTRVFQIVPDNHSLPSALIRTAMDAEASAHQLHGRGRDPQHSSSVRLRHVEIPGERGGPLPFSQFGLDKAANDLELQGKEANDLERMMSDPIGFILGIGSTKEESATGKFYFQNTDTGHVQEHDPPEWENKIVNELVFNQEDAAARSNSMALPSGWERKKCSSSGRTYYSGVHSKRLQWHTPTESDKPIMQMPGVAVQNGQQPDMGDKLKNFYKAWRVAKSDHDVMRVVSKYFESPEVLNSILRERFFGCDLNMSQQELEDKVRSSRALSSAPSNQESSPSFEQRSIQTPRSMPQGVSHLNQLGSPAQPQQPVSAGSPSDGLVELRTVRASIVC